MMHGPINLRFTYYSVLLISLCFDLQKNPVFYPKLPKCPIVLQTCRMSCHIFPVRFAGCAWGISLLLWPPWIYSWPYIEGQRTVPDHECYIQFIETNHYITFGTAIAAFYVPVTVMCILYWRIWRETEKRQKDLPNLQAGKKDSSKRSNSR